VHLDAGAVEFVLERGLPQLAQRVDHVVRRLREHGLDRTEQLDLEACEPRSTLHECGAGNAGQISSDHGGTADAIGLEAGCPGRGFGHESLERSLAQLADQEAEQEVLFLPRRVREQLAQKLALRLDGALPRSVCHALERRVHLGEFERGCVGGMCGACPGEGRIAHPDPPLPRGA